MKLRNIKFKTIIVVMAMLIIQGGMALGQPFSEPVLKPGDRVPDIKVLFHRGDSTFSGSLRQFEGKLVILDFWHIACSTCIHCIPEMWDLQKKFEGKVQIIMVTPNDDSTLAGFERKFRSNKKGEILSAKNSLLSVTGDTVLKKMFCQHGFPSHAWVDSGQHFMFLTNGSTTSSENIERLLLGEPADMGPLTGLKLDDDNPISWIDAAGNKEVSPIFNSILTHWINYRSANMSCHLVRDSISNGVVGACALDAGVLDLYRFAMQTPYEFIRRNRVICDQKDTSELFLPTDVHGYYRWYKENTYCYGLRVPADKSGEIYKIMLEDLERELGYRCVIENRKEKCFILKEAPDFVEKQASMSIMKTDSSYEEGYYYLNRVNPTDVISIVNQVMLNGREYYPVVDEANCRMKVSLLLPTEFTKGGLNIEKIKFFLQRDGFDLEEGYRTIPMFVIEKK